MFGNIGHVDSKGDFHRVCGQQSFPVYCYLATEGDRICGVNCAAFGLGKVPEIRCTDGRQYTATLRCLPKLQATFRVSVDPSLDPTGGTL